MRRANFTVSCEEKKINFPTQGFWSRTESRYTQLQMILHHSNMCFSIPQNYCISYRITDILILHVRLQSILKTGFIS